MACIHKVVCRFTKGDTVFWISNTGKICEGIVHRWSTQFSCKGDEVSYFNTYNLLYRGRKIWMKEEKLFTEIDDLCEEGGSN